MLAEAVGYHVTLTGLFIEMLTVLRDYISYSPRPFSSQHIVAELGICYETVKKYLQELIADGDIKLIGKDKGINVYIN
jgi:predicted transcriptional regulator